MVALLQGVMQAIGFILGGLILLKLTSLEFAKGIGRNEAIMAPSLILRYFSFLILIPSFFIHLKYQERQLKSEKTMK